MNAVTTSEEAYVSVCRTIDDLIDSVRRSITGSGRTVTELSMADTIRDRLDGLDCTELGVIAAVALTRIGSELGA